MLKECIRICEKYHLRYFLLGGSALGAVRHSGFIPWDDDIDIGMPRKDYEKFLSVAQLEFKNSFLQTDATDPMYPLPFAKIRNSKTTFIQKEFSHLDMNHGAFIDIFPLDGYPTNKFIRMIHVYLFRIYRATILHKLGIKKIETKRRLFISIYAVFIPLNRLREKLNNLMKKVDYEKSNVIINWNGTWQLKEAVQKDLFGEGNQVKFEGITVMIPSNSDGYLKSLYGDYMTLPPIEKRVNPHLANVIDLETTYMEHLKNRKEVNYYL